MEYEPAQLPLDLFALGRALAYAGALLLVGSCAFLALIPRWRTDLDDDRSLPARALPRAWRVAISAGGLLVVAHLLRVYGQLRSFLEPGEAITWEAARPILTQTTWGRGWLAQLGAASLALIVAWLAARRPVPGLALLGTSALAVAVTSPLTGHAGEHPWGVAFGIGLHSVHLLGGGIWLGTLATLAIAALPVVADHAALARLIAAFSPLALVGAGLAVSAGLVLGYGYVGDLTALTTSTYGRTLLVKTALLAGTMGLGAWNWRSVTPHLGTADGTRRLTRSTRLELTIGLLLIGATAVLVALPAPKI